MEKELVKEAMKIIMDGVFESINNMVEVGLDEEKEKFKVTLLISNFINVLRENNINDDIENIFNSYFLDKINIEVNKYIGDRYYE